MSRVSSLPSRSLSPTQCLRLPTSLTSSRTGPSVGADQRRRCRRRCRCRRTPRRGSPPAHRRTRPACSSGVLESTVAAGCGTAACAGFSGNGSFRASASTFDVTAPLTVRMSSQPSLSTSSHAAPKPVHGRLASRMPDGALRSSKIAGAVVDVQIVALSGQLGDERDLRRRRCRSRRRRRPCSALTEPSGLNATPERSAVFLKVPSRWLIHSWFCWLSLATKRSIQPSPLKSAVDTPSVGPDSRPCPRQSSRR